MSSWSIHVEPADCPGLACGVMLMHAAVAVLPWAAGCTPAVAAALAALALATLPHALAAVPGRRAALTGLAGDGRQWRVRLAEGRWLAAELCPGSRATAHLVLLEVAVAGRRLNWWVPRYALPASEFRRLKVAAHGARSGTGRPDC